MRPGSLLRLFYEPIPGSVRFLPVFNILLFLVISAPSNSELRASCYTADPDASACLRLGRRHLTGRGAKKDLPKAEKLLTVACGSAEREDVAAAACTQLGGMLYNGNGVRKDYARAAEAFKIACDFGGASACASLGQMTYRGIGVLEKDLEGSEALFRKACFLGWKRSCDDDHAKDRQ